MALHERLRAARAEGSPPVGALATRLRIGDLELDAPVDAVMGDLVRPHLGSIAAVEKQLEGELAKTREVVSGTSPLGALPPSVTVVTSGSGRSPRSATPTATCRCCSSRLPAGVGA